MAGRALAVEASVGIAILLGSFAACSVAGKAWGGEARPPRGDAAALRARIEAIRRQFVSRSDGLQVGPVEFPAEPPEVYGKFEASFAVRASYENPFDPAEVNVEGHFLLPDGKEVVIPAFYFVPYAPEHGVTELMMWIPFRPAGPPCWKLRFAPSRPGEHSFHITARDASGKTVRTESFAFTAIPSGRPGFVRVAAANPLYFENSGDGSLFWATGSNVARVPSNPKDPGTPRPCYEYYFGKARDKASSTRVWMCAWGAIEWTPYEVGTNWDGFAGAGYYNQMNAAAFDRIFALAEENRLRIMLTTDDNDELMLHHDYPMIGWVANPYNAANGGPCRRPEEKFSSREARRLYKNRLRYTISRWGYSDSLWALNSWNDCGYEPDAIRLEWLTEMRAYVHDLLDGYRPILYGSNHTGRADDVMDYAQAGARLHPGKPNVLQECGFTRNMAMFVPVLHGELWKGLAGGLASVMVWEHPLVDATGAWTEFRRVVDFAGRLPLHKGAWNACDVAVASARCASQGSRSRIISAAAYGDVSIWGMRAPQNVFRIDPGQDVQWLTGFCPTLYGKQRYTLAWRNPPAFVIEMPSEGKMILEMDSIGPGTPELGVTLAETGAIVTFRFPRASPWLDDTSTDGYGWAEVPLPAGKNTITLDLLNPESHWVRLRRIYFTYTVEDAEDLTQVSGLTNGERGFFYVLNRTYGGVRQLHPEIFGNAAPAPLTDVVLGASGLPDGEYEVALVDPWGDRPDRTVTSRCEGGMLCVGIDRLERDAAVVFGKRP